MFIHITYKIYIFVGDVEWHATSERRSRGRNETDGSRVDSRDECRTREPARRNAEMKRRQGRKQNPGRDETRLKRETQSERETTSNDSLERNGLRGVARGEQSSRARQRVP